MVVQKYIHGCKSIISHTNLGSILSLGVFGESGKQATRKHSDFQALSGLSNKPKSTEDFPGLLNQNESTTSGSIQSEVTSMDKVWEKKELGMRLRLSHK